VNGLFENNCSLKGGSSIKVKVFVPAFVNHELVDPDGMIDLREGAKMADLYNELKLPLPLRLSFLYCVNYEQAKWNTPLKDGDTITFLFPITGG
jgi:molybdopterin converting factor small subunit